MSILSGKLTASSGLGGITNGGPGSTSTYGMAQQQNAGIASGGSRSGVVSDFKNATSDVKAGRISLVVIEALVLLLVAFYIWTHAIQGGG